MLLVGHVKHSSKYFQTYFKCRFSNLATCNFAPFQPTRAQPGAYNLTACSLQTFFAQPAACSPAALQPAALQPAPCSLHPCTADPEITSTRSLADCSLATLHPATCSLATFSLQRATCSLYHCKLQPRRACKFEGLWSRRPPTTRWPSQERNASQVTTPCGLTPSHSWAPPNRKHKWHTILSVKQSSLFFVMYAPVTCHTWFDPFDGYTRVSCLCRVTPLTCPWGLTYCNETCRASCVAVRADVVTGPPLVYAREIERFLFAVCLLYLGAIYSMHDFWLTRYLRHLSSSVP